MSFIEWIDPTMIGGNWMPELISMAGGENLLGVDGAHIDIAALKILNPEVVIIAPCGFDMARTAQEAHLIANALQGTSAWHQGKIYIADGKQFFNRPGPRIGESLEILCELIHPGTFDFGHEGSGWEKLSF